MLEMSIRASQNNRDNQDFFDYSKDIRQIKPSSQVSKLRGDEFLESNVLLPGRCHILYTTLLCTPPHSIHTPVIFICFSSFISKMQTSPSAPSSSVPARTTRSAPWRGRDTLARRLFH